MWLGHRPAEPDPVRTGVGSRPARVDAVPGTRGRRFRARRPDATVNPRPRIRATERARGTAAVLLAVVLSACGSSPSTPSPSAATGPSVAPSTAVASSAPSPSAPASPSAAPVTVRLALDWTPNTNHLGFFVAQAKGWYADAGVVLDVLPYGGTAPEAILAAHQAECGISFQDALTFAASAGRPDRVRRWRSSSTRPRTSQSSTSSGITRPQAARRQDVRGLRLPERGADAPGRHQGRRRERQPSTP